MTPARFAILSRKERAAWLTANSAHRALIDAGHSAFKAGEILLSATRGDRYAIQWLVGLHVLPFASGPRYLANPDGTQNALAAVLGFDKNGD